LRQALSHTLYFQRIVFYMQKMDASKLYVPVASKWIAFYRNSYIRNKKRSTQFGGSIVGTTKTYIIPIEEKKKIGEPERKEINNVPINIISPSQAVVEQAETEIERQKKNIKSRSQVGGREVNIPLKRRKVHTKKRFVQMSFKEFDNIHAKRRKQTD